MKLEYQVCSLELAKRLRDLGVKQESLFYWADASLVSKEHFEILINDNKVRTLSSVNNDWPDEDVFELNSAFTVAELGEMLPHYNELGTLTMYYSSQGWWVEYNNGLGLKSAYTTCDLSLTNSLAKMLIHLIENKLIEVPR